MNSREGQIYDLQAVCSPSDLAEVSDVAPVGLNRMKGRGVPRNSSGLSHFWASEEDEMESAPRDMKQKCKRMMQKRRVQQFSPDDNESANALDAVESKWQDLPMELLVRILALVDNRTVVVACGVCASWRDSMHMGIFELSFSWCGKSVSKLVQSVAPKFSRLQSCNLRRCASLNDQAIEAVGANWHDLRALDLTNDRKLTNKSLYALANGCPQLDKLDLSGCAEITEKGLVRLAQHCNGLRHLNLCGCYNACSDAAMLALAQNCSGLQSLNVGWCECITDIGVTALALGCPDLRIVDLCGCFNITDRSVIVLADKCHQLRALGLHCCRNITDLAMYALVNNSKLRSSMRKAKRSSYSTGGREGSQYSGSARNFMSSSSVFTRSSAGSCSTSSGSSCSSSDASNPPAFTKGGFDALLGDPEGHGLVSLNLSGCTALSALAVQAVCDAFPELHTCPERPSLIISGCLNLTSVHCICVIEARRERSSRAAFKAAQAFNPRNCPL